MARNRVRIRFSKLGDLRLISHRDLARVWERMFRRANLQLAKSEGFRPKPRIHFPSALSLGVAGLEEVVEVELTAEMTSLMTDGAALQTRLSAQAPPGLTIAQLDVLPDEVKQARAELLSYELPVPPERRTELAQRIEWLLGQTSVLVAREERKPLDLRPMLDRLQLIGDTLQMRLRIDLLGTVRPGEILGVLGAADLEQHGLALTRTAVELYA